MLQCGNVTSKCNVRSMEGVTALDQGLKYHVERGTSFCLIRSPTFIRGASPGVSYQI